MEFLKTITQNAEGKPSILDNMKSWKWFGFKVSENGQESDFQEHEITTFPLDEEESEDMSLTEEDYQTKGKTTEQTAPKADNFHLIKDIEYYVEKDKHKKHKLNVYVPIDISANELLPVVVHVHGGGWKRGDRDTEFYGAPFMGRAYANRRFVCVTVSYRLAWTASHPAQIIDVARAMKWIVTNIKGFHGDTERLFISGHSAGGHIVSLLATDLSYLQQQGVDPAVIKGVISISGIYSLHDALLESSDSSCQKGAWMNAMFHMRYVNGTFGKDSNLWHQASPIYYVNDIIAKLKSLNEQETQQTQLNNEPSTNDTEPSNQDSSSKEDDQHCTVQSNSNVEATTALETALAVSSPPLKLTSNQKLPPFLIVSAEWDMGLEYGAARFFAALKQAGVHTEHKVIPATHHGSVTRCNETADEATAFIKDILSKM